MTTAPPGIHSLALTSDISHSLVAGVRLGLAATVLVAYLIDIPGQVASSQLTQAAIAGYLLYSLLLFVTLRPDSRFATHPQQHWVDIAWYGLLTAVTDPRTSGIFLFYLFAILVTSFRHGTRAGIGITFGSAAIYLGVVGSMASQYAAMEWAALVLRTFFLISLGCLVSALGRFRTGAQTAPGVVARNQFLVQPALRDGTGAGQRAGKVLLVLSMRDLHPRAA